MTEPQALEGYLCACGEKFPDKKSFNTHQLTASKKEKGVHLSRGRVNMATGEVTMPPYNDRDQKQRKASKYAVKKDNPTGNRIFRIWPESSQPMDCSSVENSGRKK